MEKKTDEIQAIFPDFESMLAFFSDKNAEYRETVGTVGYRLCISRTGNELELTRSDGYRAMIIGMDEKGRLSVKKERLLYQGLDGKTAYKSVCGVLRGITLRDAVTINGRIEKLGVSGHGFYSEHIPDTIYLTIKRRRCGCYIATCVYGSYDCPPLWVLRRFRDRILAASWCGRSLIRLYYTVSPFLVRHFGKTAWFRGFFRRFLDRLTAYLKEKGLEDTPYGDMD